jgi:uncharacterized protein YbcI
MPQRTPDGLPGERVTVRVSDAIARLFAVHTGHGATRAWTTLDENLIVCVLQNVLSKGELSLVSHGEHDLVLTTRNAYQEMISGEAVRAVEEISGRSVSAFMSANHLEPDLAAEIFVLEPLAPAV